MASQYPQDTVIAVWGDEGHEGVATELHEVIDRAACDVTGGLGQPWDNSLGVGLVHVEGVVSDTRLLTGLFPSVVAELATHGIADALQN